MQQGTLRACQACLAIILRAHMMIRSTCTPRNVLQGIGVCCAVVTRQATFAVILLTLIILVLLSFSGFLISKVRPCVCVLHVRMHLCVCSRVGVLLTFTSMCVCGSQASSSQRCGHMCVCM